MKNQKGITLVSLTIYIIAMVVVVATITTLTKFFYGNLDDLTNTTKEYKDYTLFNSYFTAEINKEKNNIIQCTENSIIFSNSNQYTYKDNTIYMNKINICNNVDSCKFIYNQTDKSKVTVEMSIDGKNYNTTYTLNI